MNLDQISLRIAEPGLSLGSEIPMLKELTEKYPYAQVFSILYLKALSNQNDIGFEEALHQHAYKITDRMKLYDLIHGEAPAVRSEMIIIEENPAVEIIIPTEIEKEESVIPVALAESVQKETKHPESEMSPVEMEEINDSLLVEISKELLEEAGIDVELEEVTTPSEHLEDTEEIIEGSHEEIFVAEAKPLEEIDEDPILMEISDELIEEAAIEEDEIQVQASLENVETERPEDPLDLEIISQIVERVYNDNLEKSTPDLPIIEKKSEEIFTEKKVFEKENVPAKKSFTSWLKSGVSSSGTVEKVTLEIPENESKPFEKQVNKIVDQFIEKDPSISRPKKEFYSPTKKAKESVSEEGFIYTETLANIFAIQGNFPKAILAYEQLILTNPEKKIFFAQRIEELKEKLNT